MFVGPIFYLSFQWKIWEKAGGRYEMILKKKIILKIGTFFFLHRFKHVCTEWIGQLGRENEQEGRKMEEDEKERENFPSWSG